MILLRDAFLAALEVVMQLLDGLRIHQRSLRSVTMFLTNAKDTVLHLFDRLAHAKKEIADLKQQIANLKENVGDHYLGAEHLEFALTYFVKLAATDGHRRPAHKEHITEILIDFVILYHGYFFDDNGEWNEQYTWAFDFLFDQKNPLHGHDWSWFKDAVNIRLMANGNNLPRFVKRFNCDVQMHVPYGGDGGYYLDQIGRAHV